MVTCAMSGTTRLLIISKALLLSVTRVVPENGCRLRLKLLIMPGCLSGLEDGQMDELRRAGKVAKEVRAKMARYERRYGMSSKEFLAAYQDGTLDEREEFFDWQLAFTGYRNLVDRFGIELVEEMVQGINTISVKEFREKGYLQELNRQFLHPLGLALSVEVEDDTESFGPIWDYRIDPEGLRFDEELLDEEFFARAKRIGLEMARAVEIRMARLGYATQPPYKE